MNAVAPGWTYSPMTRGALDPDDRRADLAHDGAAQGRDGRRHRASGVVLASDELSGHVSGELVTVAGGMEGRTIHG